MAFHHTVSSAMPVNASPNHDAARNGISLAAMAGITALLDQLETHPTLSSLAVSVVADAAEHKRTMTCRKGVWDGYDLTHPFPDDRSTAWHQCAHHYRTRGYAALPVANAPVPQLLSPAHLVIQPQVQTPPQPPPQPIYLPKVQAVVLLSATPCVAPYASAPAAQAPHMILRTTSATSQ